MANISVLSRVRVVVVWLEHDVDAELLSALLIQLPTVCFVDMGVWIVA